MKKILSIMILAFITFASATSFASTEEKTLVFVNHFKDPLVVSIVQYPQVVPNWPRVFILQPGERSRETVITTSPDPDMQAFINVHSLKNEKTSVFMGIQPTQVHVLLDPTLGFAFSWNNQAHQTMFFCDSATFKRYPTSMCEGTPGGK